VYDTMPPLFRVFVVLPLLFVAGTAFAQTSALELRPAILRSEDAFTLAVRFSGAVRDEYYSQPAAGTYPKGWYYSAAAEGAVALKPRHNPENLTAKLNAGWSISLKRTPEPPEFSPDDPEPQLPRPTKDWGFIEIGADVKAEADQVFDAVNLAGGGELSYINIKDEGWWFLVPSVVVGLNAVKPLKSDLRDSIDEDLSPFARIDGAASWKFLIGQRLNSPILRPLGLHVDFRFFNSFGLPEIVEESDDPLATYVALDVSYSLTDRLPYVREIFVRFSNGRLPPEIQSTSAIYAGIVLGETP